MNETHQDGDFYKPAPKVPFKEKIQNSLGVFGFILNWILSTFILYIPFSVLKFPFLLDLFLFAIVITLPFIGAFVSIVLWAWSFFAIIKEPIDWFSIVYFICLAINVFIYVVPVISSCFSVLRQKNSNIGRFKSSMFSLFHKKAQDAKTKDRPTVIQDIAILTVEYPLLEVPGSTMIKDSMYSFYDAVIFVLFIVRAMCISCGCDEEKAQSFTKDYIDLVITRVKKKFNINKDIVHEMMTNRLAAYDETFLNADGEFGEKASAVMQEFSILLQQDYSIKKYEPFSPRSPIYLVGIVELTQCDAEAMALFYSIPTAFDELIKTASEYLLQ